MGESARTPATGPRARGWRTVAIVIALPTIVPLIVVLGAFATPQAEVWEHLRTYVLPGVLVNTLWLVTGVALLTAVLGTSLGWLTAACEFPGRRFFDWALLLPLAMPGYVVAFVAIALLDYTGPVQSALRELFGADAWFPAVRSRGGVIVVMTLVLYPYVYLLARNAFATQGRRELEVARSLGMRRGRAFRRLVLPMARPWIAGGVMLVVMETLADFGTVAVFNYDTFTTAIYDAWLGLFSIEAALQLSSVLVLLVLVVFGLERGLRRGARYTADGGCRRSRIALRGGERWLASGFAATVLLVAFVVPAAQLLVWSAASLGEELSLRYLSAAAQSVGLGLSAAALIVAVAVLLGYARRNDGAMTTRLAARVATLGYALPGTVLAVGIFVPLASLSGVLDRLLASLTGAGAPGLVLQSTLITMIAAYLVRFLALAFNPVESNLLRIDHSLDDASRSLGVGGVAMLRRVHLPMLRGGVLTAMTLVFVDIMKEMPITLMTRPFGWETLAVRVYQLTAEGLWERAALPALTIVLAGLLPVVFIMRGSRDAA